ncbi:NUDIX hydrolase [Phenylobacterium soli]|uniref:DNA mismatch repair protein MutT n=1 Tax=Phenylobacterium soli TaxID=2170551 RepID=A0A328AN42_9CAUL|nr:NUDIX hydrolase [Phenylobacterium soli]RAK55979.1 DNA mismatch repair protein MutT [Phenylobacterium soli]
MPKDGKAAKSPKPKGAKPKRPRRQYAALPWRRTETGVEILLITSRETRRWVLPKGWGKKDEPATIAVAREALEETGVAGRVAEKPLGQYRYQKLFKSGRLQRLKVTVYGLEVVHEHAEWPEMNIRDKLWVSLDEGAGLVDEPELRSLIAGFSP